MINKQKKDYPLCLFYSGQLLDRVDDSRECLQAMDFRMVRHGVGEGIEISLCEIKTMNIGSSSRLRENFQARLDTLFKKMS